MVKNEIKDRMLYPRFVERMDTYLGRTFKITHMLTDDIVILDDLEYRWNVEWLT